MIKPKAKERKDRELEFPPVFPVAITAFGGPEG